MYYLPPPFSRPTEFLPMEYAGIRGLEQKMYKEQETLKGKNHSEVHEAYSRHCAKLATHNAVFFPARVSECGLLCGCVAVFKSCMLSTVSPYCVCSNQLVIALVTV